MSIIITGLNMPTERKNFNLTIKYNGTVLDTETGIQVAEAHELPAHGRLIDADAFIEKCKEIADKEDGNQLDALVLLEWFLEQNAPTIIPAEENTDVQKKFLQNWHEDGE